MCKGKCMKKSIAMALPRIVVGILFTVSGFSKLFMIGAAGFATMAITPVFGITGILALVVAWLVIIGEILGGLVLLAGKFIPTKIYQMLISVLIVIMLGATIFIYGRAGDIMGVLTHLVIISVLFNISMTSPVCPIGITGKKCSECKCEDGKCTDGTCQV